MRRKQFPLSANTEEHDGPHIANSAHWDPREVRENLTDAPLRLVRSVARLRTGVIPVLETTS